MQEQIFLSENRASIITENVFLASKINGEPLFFIHFTLPAINGERLSQ